MLLKSVTLENIRSYRNETRIDFEEGITLFVGEVGSGKSTILMAIEFVLFATVEEYENLLSVGARRGIVKIEIEGDHNLYELRREIYKDGEKLSANDCYIAIKDTAGKNKLQRKCTLNDLRQFVMKELLGIKSEASRKNPLYRYAIYTRQGEIRKILEDKDQIKELIRKIFRLDEYKVIIENIDIAREKLKFERENRNIFLISKKNIYEELNRKVSEMEENIKLLGDKESFLSDIQRKLEKIKSECSEMEKLYEDLSVLRTEREKKLAEILSLQREIDSIKSRIKDKEDIVKRLQNESHIPEKYRELEKRIEELRNIEKEKVLKLKKLKDVDGRLREIYVQLKNLDELERKLKEKTEEKSSIESKADNINIIREELTKLEEDKSAAIKKMGILQEDINRLESELREFKELREKSVCPKCRRPLSYEHVLQLIDSTEKLIIEKKDSLKNENKKLGIIESEIIRKKDEERKLYELMSHLKRINREIEEIRRELMVRPSLITEKEKLELEKNSLESEIKELEKKLAELEIIQEEYKNISKLYLEYVRLSERLREIERLENILNERFIELQNTRSSVQHIEKEIESLENIVDEKLLKRLREELRRLEIEEAEIKKDIIHIKQTLSRLDNEIKELNNEINVCETCKKEIERITILSEVLDKLSIAVKKIEELKFRQIYEDLSGLFDEFFGEFKEILSDRLEVYIDENFQPVAKRYGTEVSLASLSGGEKTSIALSYRLALNSLVKRYLNLRNIFLILDEPTEGFSRELLVKLKEVLNKIDANQIIVVSHDEELTNIADVVYRVRIDKDNIFECSRVERL